MTIKQVLEKYGTKRAYDSITSNTGYYDFMVGDKRVHIRLSDHFKDEKDDAQYDIQIIKGSGETWILRYGKFTITGDGESFAEYLDAFLKVFPDVSKIVDTVTRQVEDNVRRFIEVKTDYEEERKAFREYRERFRGLDELEKRLESAESEIRKRDKVIADLESHIRSQRDRIRALESENPDFQFLNDLKDTYGQLLQEINTGLKKVKELRRPDKQTPAPGV